jgi:hypothetical protein
VPDCGFGVGCTAPNTCGAQAPNVCGCRNETTAEFCARLGISCGIANGVDNCGANRSPYCGTCTPGDAGVGDAGDAGNSEDHTAFFTGDDVSAALKAAGLVSGAYLKVYITLTPSTDKLYAPTVTEFRQQFDCVPSQ